MSAFDTILDNAKSDPEFAKALFIDPVATCDSAGIALNDAQKKLLTESVQKSQTYFAEQLFLLTKKEDVLGNTFCVFGLCIG